MSNYKINMSKQRLKAQHTRSLNLVCAIQANEMEISSINKDKDIEKNICITCNDTLPKIGYYYSRNNETYFKCHECRIEYLKTENDKLLTEYYTLPDPLNDSL